MRAKKIFALVYLSFCIGSVKATSPREDHNARDTTSDPEGITAGTATRGWNTANVNIVFPDHSIPAFTANSVPSPFSQAADTFGKNAIYPLHPNLHLQGPFPLPVLRNDVMQGLLAKPFKLSSNFPLKGDLSLTQRKSLYDFATKHLQDPTTRFLHMVIEEPQLDLSKNLQLLYLMTPILDKDWKSDLGVMEPPELKARLAFIFYKASVEKNHHSHFRVAGIEVITDREEASNVFKTWTGEGAMQSLEEISKSLHLTVTHGPPR